MKIIEKLNKQAFPLEWANLECYSESKANKKEIYLIENNNLIEGLILMFYTLFREGKNSLYIYNSSWWDFCLDTWETNKNKYNYDIEGKSDETKEYLKMLQNSNINNGYSGNCKCLDWEIFLQVVVKCIISHQAPYSPIFYDEKNDFFFYFHHSGSIGIYYHKTNECINQILLIANEEYVVR